jgi:3-phosphoshikimate 1-carboxyvinyltransferase
MTQTTPNYPEQLTITPCPRPPRCRILVPGSKSITNRALVLAALAGPVGDCQETVLTGALQSEDTEVMVDCLHKLGIAVSCDWPLSQMSVPASGGNWPNGVIEDLFVANSGTTMRFLTALVSLCPGRYRLDGVPRMRERPIEDLLSALNQLGVRASSETGNGCPPVVIETGGLDGGTVRIKGDVSSQFLSGLLMAAPLARGDVVIEVEGHLVSWPYVDMTLRMMRHFGADVAVEGQQLFRIRGRQVYRAQTYGIEPDASAASYFAGAAAVLGGAVELLGLTRDSLQGDIRFLDVLARMGCTVQENPGSMLVRGGPLRGIDVDMNDISDTVMTLGAVACFAAGPTTIRNVGHIRHKETDRLAALAAELRRIGAAVDEWEDGITITPQPLHGAEIETYNDHRMAMSLALVGLRVAGIVLKNPGCVAKTYPRFFDDLERLRE